MGQTEKPLAGIRVLELGSSEAAGMAGLLLSDFGAEVIRVDAPPRNGDDAVQSNEDAITFGLAAGGERLCDRGKKRVFLDLRTEEQRALLLRLLKTCDGVLDGLHPGVTDGLGLDGGTLEKEVPGLVYVQVTGYGASGPYADRPWSEAAIQAESGFVSTTGPEGGDPVRSGGDMASALGGLTACIAMLAGLLDRQKSHTGRQMDVSMMDSILFGLENQFSLYLKSGVVPKPKGNSYALSAPVGNFLCGDGKEIMISVATETQWQAFAEALHKEEWLSRPEYVNVSRRIENYKLLGQEVAAAFSNYTREDLMEVLQSRSCIYGCINDFDAVSRHRQTEARNMFITVTGPDGRSFKAPGNPIMRGDRSDGTAVIHAAGADTAEILELCCADV